MSVVCYLDSCPAGHLLEDESGSGTDYPCVLYSCEVDGVVSWQSHAADSPTLLARLNGSYDTFDRRNGVMLAKENYASELAAELVDPGSRQWWKPWTWRS